jgi:hypothetical protein
MSQSDRPDDWASASEEEKRAADALRDAIDRGVPHADLELIESIRAAAHPKAIARARHDAIVRRALGPRKVVYGLFGAAGALAIGAAGALAIAAAAALVLWRLEPPPAPFAFRSRSSADLFDAQFPVQGGTSDRVDRIATARRREMRNDLFAGRQTR